MKRILIPVDFSACSVTALRLGLALANHHRARVTMLHASGLLEHARLPMPLVEEQRRARGEASARDLRALSDELAAAHIPVEIEVRHCEPVTGILAFAAEWQPDLIVMGSHGERAGAFMLGSVSSRTALLAPCPVLIARQEHAARFPAGGRFRRPVVAVDYSRFSVPAVRVAAALADPDATLELIHVYFAHDFEVTPELQAALGEARAEELEALKELADRVDIAPVRCSARAELGRVADQLSALVDGDDTDLVVLGAHSRDVEHPRLGSVADRMLRTSAAPVLILGDRAVPARD